MTDVFSVVAAALHADHARLDQAGLNAANAATPGYRRSTVVATSFDQALASAEATMRMPALPTLQPVIDFTPGALQRTGRDLDVAVEGKGFIVMTDGQQTWLTRTASLSLGKDGELLGPKGMRLQAAQGDLRTQGDEPLTVEANGNVRQGQRLLGRIRFVEPTDAAQLSSNDGVLFSSADQQLKDVEDSGVIRSGFLEGSNTNHLKEMMSVMETVRHFESLTRVAQGYDDALGRAIQKLGDI
jgi:flagellar basal-body rod protein FlgF